MNRIPKGTFGLNIFFEVKIYKYSTKEEVNINLFE